MMKSKLNFQILFVFLLISLPLGAKKNVQKDLAETKQYIETLYAGISGFGISSEESQKITDEGGSPIYGEITYESTQQLLDDLQLTKHDVLYDLGCGVGKMVIQVYLNSRAKKCVGIELSPSRIHSANLVREKLAQDKKIKKLRKLNFWEENITKADIKDATVVYLCSTCFSEQLMRDLTENFTKCRKGLRVITLKKLPDISKFTLLKEYKLAMTWSSDTSVYLYQLI